ncbi:homocitrate synthase [Anaerocolumna sp. MB42-C2]|uniref:homocitrate synthase n=1 Tax=Anaerocolumna sp. MB42-C2 TaxID=3070997 RepID=UPI0027E1FE2F|nr:homocitrate synthase [Anaerocolumna sp. MB42-C2]WMJ88821.1 homocitrate synthase [Anaerocolumna sp. MB42-C2]
MKPKRWIVDTTLRDGEQCPGIAFQPEDKIKLALLLDEIGIHEIEIGVFAKEQEAYIIDKIISHKKNSEISVWCRLVEEDVRFAVSLCPDRIHIGMPVSYIQIYGKLNKNKDWIINQTSKCLEIISKAGISATVGFEDSSRADIGFIKRMARYVSEMGASTIRLADTVGVFVPSNSIAMVKELISEIPVTIETHEHNDLGMAVANTIAMAGAGAKLLDCTLLGIGERAGNCNMYDLIHSAERLFDLGVDKHKVKLVEETLIDILKYSL